MTVAAIVLAAGKGTRMRSDRPKVLHRAAGRTLLEWVLATVEPVADRVVTVVGHDADRVVATLPEGVAAAVQQEQLGTADAAQVGLDAIEAAADVVLVVPGDMPLLRPATLERLLAVHREGSAAATVLTVRLDDPTGYGRILRSGDRVVAIIEERDATDEQRRIDEVNTSVYVFDRPALADALGKVDAGNAQGELYLTDVVGILDAAGLAVHAVRAPSEEGLGVNSHAELAAAAAALRDRINRAWMEAGVAMEDPCRTYVDGDVVLEPGARLLPDVHLEGATVVRAGAEVGPSVHARDAEIGPGARVRFAVLDGAVVGPGANVGPFTYLRPGAVLAEAAKAGTFVELKNTTVGSRSKVPHLAYLGDATVGEDANVGAGTITCNYDGYVKHRTVIGDRAFIGSDTMLVAPVEVGDDAVTGAGSVITRDVPPGALAVERSQQMEVPGYAERRRRRAEEERGSS